MERENTTLVVLGCFPRHHIFMLWSDVKGLFGCIDIHLRLVFCLFPEMDPTRDNEDIKQPRTLDIHDLLFVISISFDCSGYLIESLQPFFPKDTSTYHCTFRKIHHPRNQQTSQPQHPSTTFRCRSNHNTATTPAELPAATRRSTPFAGTTSAMILLAALVSVALSQVCKAW